MPGFPRQVLLLLAIAAALPAARADTPEDMEFFEKHVRPILVENCYSCHSEESGKRKGGLWLDRKAGWEEGGDSGPAVKPRQPDTSLLISSIRYHNRDLEMPPDGRLPAEAIARLEEWVKRGAPDPRDEATSGKNAKPIDLAEGRKFWSFQPIQDRPSPPVADAAWPHAPLDRFVLAKLEAKGFRPAPDASKDVLLRRVTLLLTGLPPTLAEQAAFAADDSGDALAQVVDRLLASDSFAERWGRHWLDMVRYSDSTGGGRSMPLPDAWRFRDYVIESFRQDKPLDRLIREHIAGDLMPAENQAQKVSQLVATGFLVMGPHNYENQDKELLNLEIADEQVDTIGRAFLGMSIGCARCHDHKFDPIPTADYYAMAGIFTSSHSVDHSNVSKWATAPITATPEEAAALAAHQQKEIQLLDEIEFAKEKLTSTTGTPAKEDAARVKKLEADLKRLKKEQEKFSTVMCIGESPKPADTPIRIRGGVRNFGPIAPRGFLQVTMPANSPAPAIAQGSGRMELANWVTSPENPLTARVLANRIWMHLVGEGIVTSLDNFGTTGVLPTHPELLDHLAHRLIANGWSTKALIREIVLSRTWGMSSSGGDAKAEQIDPGNQFLWRAHRRKADVETLRDSILTLAGTLDTAAGGPSLPEGLQVEFDFKFTTLKRSVYVPVFRNVMHEMFSTFDFANPNFVSSKRTESTLPTQALFFLNSPFMHEQGAAAAGKLLAGSASVTDEERIRLAYRAVLARDPAPREAELTLAFLRAEGDSATADSPSAWGALMKSLFSCVEFQYIR